MNENNVNKALEVVVAVLESPKLNQLADQFIENSKYDLLLKKREL